MFHRLGGVHHDLSSIGSGEPRSFIDWVAWTTIFHRLGGVHHDLSLIGSGGPRSFIDWVAWTTIFHRLCGVDLDLSSTVSRRPRSFINFVTCDTMRQDQRRADKTEYRSPGKLQRNLMKRIGTVQKAACHGRPEKKKKQLKRKRNGRINYVQTRTKIMNKHNQKHRQRCKIVQCSFAETWRPATKLGVPQ